MANSDLDKRIIVPLYYFLHHKVVLRFFFHFTLSLCFVIPSFRLFVLSLCIACLAHLKYD